MVKNGCELQPADTHTHGCPRNARARDGCILKRGEESVLRPLQNVLRL